MSRKPPPSPSAPSGQPVFRFIILFALILSGLYLLTITPWAENRAWPAYLRVNAEASGAILRLLGQPATVADRSIIAPGAALLIERGCDAVHPSALFLAAVLASPVALWTKLPGVFIGTFALMALNLVRIVSLFYVRRFRPDVFEVMHVEVWQALFIFLAVLFWALWAVWATRRG